MIDVENTFANFINNLVKNNFPGLNFYTEPNFQRIGTDDFPYPALTLHWGDMKKTKTLAIWSLEVDIDVIYPDYKRAECNKTIQQLFELLNLAADVPGKSRRTIKTQFLDEETNILNIPTDYIPEQSDIQWRFADGEIHEIEESDKPELIRKSFTLTLLFKNR